MLRRYRDDREYYESLPKKRLGVGVLLFYKQELLIVQPTYNPRWILPGGTVEAEEAPLEALQREILSELSIRIFPTQLLAVDYVSNRDVKGEYLQLLFAAQELSEAQGQNIRLPLYELKDHKFVSIEKALEMLTPLVARRLESVLKAQENGLGAVYLEDGRNLYESFKASIASLYSLPKT